MASGDMKDVGRGSQGKGSGAGAATNFLKHMAGENDVLFNRDKKRHTKQCGLDGNRTKSDQYQDHAADRIAED
jgi:hypothetical protein